MPGIVRLRGRGIMDGFYKKTDAYLRKTKLISRGLNKMGFNNGSKFAGWLGLGRRRTYRKKRRRIGRPCGGCMRGRGVATRNAW